MSLIRGALSVYPLHQVEELILDNVRESKLVGLSDDFTALVTLSAINVGLTSLDGLPSLPSITKVTYCVWWKQCDGDDVTLTSLKVPTHIVYLLC